MSVRELIDLFDRHLPCPPNPMPERGSDGDYLCQATLFNAGKERPHRIVEMHERQPYKHPWECSMDDIVRIIRVECDERGKGIRVIR
jgi:hypothetical protein